MQGFSEETLTLTYTYTREGNYVHILYKPENMSMPNDYIEHGVDLTIGEGDTPDSLALEYMPTARKAILDLLYNNPYEEYV